MTVDSYTITKRSSVGSFSHRWVRIIFMGIISITDKTKVFDICDLLRFWVHYFMMRSKQLIRTELGVIRKHL